MARAARSARLATVRSGFASADLTAPTPGRAEGRLTQTAASGLATVRELHREKYLTDVQHTMGRSVDAAQGEFE